MSEFEYLAVFVSIIFGISVTHVLAGVMRSFYRGERDQTHYVFSTFLFLVLILDWWTGINWRSQEIWSFDLFLIIIIWAVTHYLAAITLYPPQSAGAEQPFAYRHKWFLWAFVALATMDVVQTGARGDLFTPWTYLPFVAHYIVFSLLAIVIDKPGFHRVMAWWLLGSTVVWSFVVRRFIE